jgi:hypothetical protein
MHKNKIKFKVCNELSSFGNVANSHHHPITWIVLVNCDYNTWKFLPTWVLQCSIASFCLICFSFNDLLGHIHNQGTTFPPHDSRTLILLSSKYII